MRAEKDVPQGDSIAKAPVGGGPATIYRVDLPCEQAGFTRPPYDVHFRAFPAPANGGTWTLLAHSSPGKADVVARWLAGLIGIRDVHVGPGLSPRVFRATVAALPPAWSIIASFAKVHHLDVGTDGMAAWFVECTRDEALALMESLQLTRDKGSTASKAQCRLAYVDWTTAPLSRRQMEVLSTAVAMGYYEIPHRTDLRTLAKATGVSLGSAAELLRRAEATVLKHYVDANLMGWPISKEDELRSFRPTVPLTQQ